MMRHVQHGWYDMITSTPPEYNKSLFGNHKGGVQAGRFEQRGLDPADLSPHQRAEKRQALAAQEQRPRVLLVLAGGVRVPLRPVPNAQAGIRQRLAQNRPEQGDVALAGVAGLGMRL